MYKSTRKYCAVVIKKLMEQCGISIWDIQKVVDDIKYPPGCLGYHDVDEFYKDDEDVVIIRN